MRRLPQGWYVQLALPPLREVIAREIAALEK